MSSCSYYHKKYSCIKNRVFYTRLNNMRKLLDYLYTLANLDIIYVDTLNIEKKFAYYYNQ